MSPHRPVRAVLLAPNADGEDVGEAWSTFQWVARLAERHPITVLTYAKRGHRPLSEQLPQVRVIEWPDMPLVHRCERFQSMAKPGQWLFHRRARRWLRAALAHGERFDLVHQFAPLALRYASPAVDLGIPFVLGPVGGSVQPTPAMQRELQRQPWYVRLRSVDRLRLAMPGALRRSYRQAAHVLAVAPYVREVLGDIPLRRCSYEAETGIVELPARCHRAPGSPGSMHLLYVGRLVRSKGLYYGLEAMAGLRHLPGVTLTVIGDGEERAACEQLVRERGLASRVRFLGRLPRAAIDDHYRSADAFLFPSFREASGNVVFEAMSHALPVITCRAGGPGHVVDEACGRLVTPSAPDALVAGLRDAIADLAAAPGLRSRLGEAARQRVQTLAHWPDKVARVERLWHEVIDASPASSASP